MDETEIQVAVIALLVVGGLAAAGGLTAATTAENLHGGSVSPDTVQEDTKEKHDIAFKVDDVSKDGSTDEFYVQFPDGVTLQPNSASVFNRTDGSSVSITSSISVVDGPDGDGVKDSLKFAVSPDGEGTVDVNATVSTYVTWPSVDGTERATVGAAVEDSARGAVETTRIAQVAIVDENVTSTPSGTPATPTGTGPPPGESTSVPAFPAGAAAIVVLGVFVYRLAGCRRRL